MYKTLSVLFLVVVCGTYFAGVYSERGEWKAKMAAVENEYKVIQEQTDAENTKRLQRVQTVAANAIKQGNDIQHKFDAYVRDVMSTDSVQSDSAGSKDSMPDCTCITERVKTTNSIKCPRQSNGRIKAVALKYAKEADECAVKFNSLLDLYREVQNGS